jgi:hypothetical protein
MEWSNFSDDPDALTGISGMCAEGKHEACGGIVAIEGQEGEVGVCVCPCHPAPGEVQ